MYLRHASDYSCLLLNRWDAPRRLLSDQGREFVNKVKHPVTITQDSSDREQYLLSFHIFLFFFQINDAVCKEFGIKRSITTAYHPQTNGLDERINQTLRKRLSKFVNEKQDNWNEYLEEVAYSMRTQ